jgi:hypothetical protein
MDPLIDTVKHPVQEATAGDIRADRLSIPFVFIM